MTKVQLIWFELYAVLWERECRSHQVRHVGIMEIARDDNLGIDSKEPWPRDARGRFDPSRSLLFMHEYGHYLQSQEYGWGYLFSVGIPSLKSAIRDHNWSAEIEDKTRTENRFVVSKHMTHWFEISANRKAAKYFSGRGVVWDYKQYPLNISKILSYFQYDNYNRINIKYL